MIGLDPSYIETLATSLDRSSAMQQRLSGEVSSGSSLTSLADDPSAAGENTALSARLSEDASFVQTASTTASRMQLTDSVLGSVVSQLTEAISVSMQGTSGTANGANLGSVAQQLSGIRDEVLSLANTSYLGTFLFAGSKGTTQPFTLNTTTTPASAAYNGDTAANILQTPAGQKIQTTFPGAQIFTAGGADVLGVLNSLIADFGAGDTAAAASDASQLSGVLAHVSTQRAALDNSISRLSVAGQFAQSEETQLTAMQTNLIQADLPQVATQLSLAESQQSALEAVIASIEKQGTLFDLLR